MLGIRQGREGAGMRPRQIAMNRETGEVFIETSKDKWQEQLEKWRRGEGGCPMPIGHYMFKGNKTYEKLV